MLIECVCRVTFVWRRGWGMQMPSKNSRFVLRMGRGARRTGRNRRSGTAPLYVRSRSDPRHWLILTLTLGRARHERRRAAVDIQGEVSVTIFRVVPFVSVVSWISQPTYVFISCATGHRSLIFVLMLIYLSILFCPTLITFSAEFLTGLYILFVLDTPSSITLHGRWPPWGCGYLELL